MSRHKPRHTQPFSEFINWTDYRWEPNPFRGTAAGPRAWTPHAPPRRRYSFLQVFLAGLAVVLGLKLISALKNSALRNSGNRSVLERGALGLVLVFLASYVSKRSRL